MDQLDKIISHIEYEARQEAESILADAKEKCKKIQDDGEAEAKKEYDSALCAQKIKEERAYEAVISSIEREKRMINLRNKTEIINRTMDEAKKIIAEMDFADYEKNILLLAEKYSANDKKGEAYLPESDFKRLSDSAKEKLSVLGLDIKSGGKNFPKGIVIKYGDVEENCTIDALFREKKEALSDIIVKELF